MTYVETFDVPLLESTWKHVKGSRPIEVTNLLVVWTYADEPSDGTSYTSSLRNFTTNYEPHIIQPKAGELWSSSTTEFVVLEVFEDRIYGRSREPGVSTTTDWFGDSMRLDLFFKYYRKLDEND